MTSQQGVADSQPEGLDDSQPEGLADSKPVGLSEYSQVDGLTEYKAKEEADSQPRGCKLTSN